VGLTALTFLLLPEKNPRLPPEPVSERGGSLAGVSYVLGEFCK